MTDQVLKQLWINYQDAWADIPVPERESLLKQSVSDDVVFTNPTSEGKGIGNLVLHIGEFQAQFPGAHFESDKVCSQHGQLLAEWTMFSKEGSPLLTGYSYARFDEAGRLFHLAGFWQA